MFSKISWGQFASVVIPLTTAYYLFILLQLYRKKIMPWLKKKAGLFIFGLSISTALYAQDGKKGIDQANDMVRGYFTEGVTLVYAISGVLGLIGAIRVFKAFNDGHSDEAKRFAAAWFGRVLFVIVVVNVIKVFFGL